MVEFYQKKRHHIHIKLFKTVRSVCGVNIETPNITINPIIIPDDMHLGTTLRMDSHAYTICVNKHTFIESIVEVLTVDTVSFEKIIGKLSGLPIVNSTYAYDNLNIFCTILLQMNHAIYIEDMKHALLFPNQARKYGTIINNSQPPPPPTLSYRNWCIQNYGQLH